MSAPLEASDPQRAGRLKGRIAARLRDLPRHFRALNAARAEFGQDFDRDTFAAAAASEEPEPLNRVHAVERGLDAELPGFQRAYLAWVKAGFPASLSD